MMMLETASVSVPFKAVTDLDAHPPLLRRDQKERAVVVFGLAQFPGSEQRVGVRLDLLAAKRGHGRDDELDSGFLFEIGELALKIGDRDRRKDVRLVNNPSGQRGKVGRRERRAGPQGREERDDQRPRPDERRLRPKAGHASAPSDGLELHLGRGLGFGIGGERNQRLDRAEHRLRPEHAREGPQRRVEVLH